MKCHKEVSSLAKGERRLRVAVGTGVPAGGPMFFLVTLQHQQERKDTHRHFSLTYCSWIGYLRNMFGHTVTDTVHSHNVKSFILIGSRFISRFFYTFSMMFNSRYAGGRASSCPMSHSHSFFFLMRRDPKVRPAYDDICTARWPTGKKRRQIHNDTVPVPTMEDFPDVLHNSGSDGDTRSIQVRGPKRCAYNLQSSYCLDRYVAPRKICYDWFFLHYTSCLGDIVKHGGVCTFGLEGLFEYLIAKKVNW